MYTGTSHAVAVVKIVMETDEVLGGDSRLSASTRDAIVAV